MEIEIFLTTIATYLLISIFLFSFLIVNFEDFKILKSGTEVENRRIKYIAITIISLLWIIIFPAMLIVGISDK